MPKNTRPKAPDGWLYLSEFAEKYGWDYNRAYNTHRQGRLISKKDEEGNIIVLGVGLAQHPTTKADRRPKGASKVSASPRNSNLDPQRKKALRRKYLPIFLEKADPGQMVFTAQQLIDLFGIKPNILYRDWRRWGIIRSPIPDDYRHLSATLMSADYIYYRRDVYNFLIGDWESHEKGTQDDIIIGAATGAQAIAGHYYEWDESKVFPMTGPGFLAWLKEREVMIENKRLKKWMQFIPREEQKEFFLEALKAKSDGDFQYKMAIMSTPRGEGKSLCICLLALFFFFNGYSETIILAGNSKDQSKFTHYDLCKAIIQHTPQLMKTPGIDIKEKNITLKSGPKEVFNSMQAVPTSVGLLPNTTRAIFTELHNLRDTKFFYDLWTSLRNVPNAMVLVDTTVARPGHIVHKLWETYTKGEDPLIYFFHYADKHYNPEMTEEDLNHFKKNMPETLFNMYFRNRWGDAAGALFSVERIREIGVYGIGDKYGPTPELAVSIKKLLEHEHTRNNFERGKVDLAEISREIAGIEKTLLPIDDIYKIPASSEDLRTIGKQYGVKFIVGVGLDRAQSLSQNPGRTVMTCVARGVVNMETSFYFVLDTIVVKEYTLDTLAEKFMEWSIKYGWIDKVVVETYAGEDFYNWCMDKAAEAEFVSPTWSRQKPIFMHLYQIVEQGYLKCPRIPYYADEEGRIYLGYTNQNDVLRDEFHAFTFIPGKTEKTGWFGSTEKNLKGGTQDDTMYALAWAISATHGEGLSPTDGRGGNRSMPGPIINTNVVGDYR